MVLLFSYNHSGLWNKAMPTVEGKTVTFFNNIHLTELHEMLFCWLAGSFIQFHTIWWPLFRLNNKGEETPSWLYYQQLPSRMFPESSDLLVSFSDESLISWSWFNWLFEQIISRSIIQKVAKSLKDIVEGYMIKFQSFLQFFHENSFQILK